MPRAQAGPVPPETEKAGASAEKKPATTQPAKGPATRPSFSATTDANQPLIHMNDYLSIVYLPDFDEDYAVEVNSPLGIGSADIAMKYGWMVEHAAWQVDNSQFGQIVSQAIQTGEKAAASIINPEAGIASAEDALNAKAKSKGTDKTVLLRVRYVVEAEPGLYTILKPKEYVGMTRPSAIGGTSTVPIAPTYAGWQLPANPVLLPMPPFTLAGYNFERVIQFELVDELHP